MMCTSSITADLWENKMKRIIALILICILMAGCSGTGPSEAESKMDAPGGTDITLPSTLTMDAVLSQDYPAEVAEYTVTWITVDQENAIKTLLSEPEYEHFDYAEGDSYQINDGSKFREILNMYNKDVVHGGIVFNRYTVQNYDHELSVKIRLHTLTKDDEPISSTQVMGWLKWKAFSDKEALDFASRDEVADEVLGTMRTLGFDNIEIESILARDADTANYNREIYNEYVNMKYLQTPEESGAPQPDTSIQEVFTTADEDYYIIMREIIDGVPITDSLEWQEVRRQKPTHVEMYATYNAACGIADIWVRQFVTVQDKRNTVDVMSPEEALQIYLDEYNKSIHLKDSRITKLELNHVVIIDGEEMYTRPCWMIHVETEADYTNHITDEPMYEYKSYAITADTGVILASNMDTR